MRILVVGSGAREDALTWRLAQSPGVTLFAAPGNAGTASRATNLKLSPTDGRAIVSAAQEHEIDLVVLGPEVAIAAGVGDRLRDAGIAVFGPNRGGGRLESSKAFAKRFMERHGVPTARFAVVHSLDQAKAALASWRGGVVVKADGLAAGKGVVVCDDAQAALATLEQWYVGNNVPGGGVDVVLEERLRGREVSVFAICDGRAIVPIGAACDYKRAGDGDTGPNTGGMGAYSPPHGFPEDLYDQVRERILAPVLRGLLAEGEPYIGVLYCGLMWTQDGPQVIEFNVRFGDPETQVLMPRINGDFAELLKSAAEGAMDLSQATISQQACVGVVLATSDYPRSNTPLQGLNADLQTPEGVAVFWGGSERNGDTVKTGGGRVMTVSALGDDVADARNRAYDALRSLAAQLGTKELSFRTDIAKL